MLYALCGPNTTSGHPSRLSQMAGRSVARLLLANILIGRARKPNLVFLVALLYTLTVANDFTGLCRAMWRGMA